MDCVFCKIISGDIPSRKVYEDELSLAFYDIAPQAPVHILVIPKEHIPSAACINEENAAVAAHLLTVTAKIAHDLNLVENGFRIVSNCGENAGQTVPHLHFHILAGKKLTLEMA